MPFEKKKSRRRKRGGKNRIVINLQKQPRSRNIKGNLKGGGGSRGVTTRKKKNT